MKRYLVGVTIVDRYWGVQVYQEADTPEDAVAQTRSMFVEQMKLLGVEGFTFRVGDAEALTAP